MLKQTRKPWRVRLDPVTAQRVADLNFRIEAAQRVLAALVSCRNVLIRTGRPISTRKPPCKATPAQTPKPLPKQRTLFD